MMKKTGKSKNKSGGIEMAEFDFGDEWKKEEERKKAIREQKLNEATKSNEEFSNRMKAYIPAVNTLIQRFKNIVKNQSGIKSIETPRYFTYESLYTINSIDIFTSSGNQISFMP